MCKEKLKNYLASSPGHSHKFQCYTHIEMWEWPGDEATSLQKCSSLNVVYHFFSQCAHQFPCFFKLLESQGTLQLFNQHVKKLHTQKRDRVRKDFSHQKLTDVATQPRPQSPRSLSNACVEQRSGRLGTRLCSYV